jgi:2-polyprenyl-6-methoxyphenol hydroxylase-like FAD-dependent oxidoreductase
VLNDPLTGQGANTASYAAETLAGAIGRAERFDETFCREVEGRIWAYTRCVTEQCNRRLQPPPQHMLALLAAAARNQEVADFYASAYNRPDQFWPLESSPERMAAFLADVERQQVAV